MRAPVWVLLCVVAGSSCSSGTQQQQHSCTGGTGDAGLAPRALGEWCGEDGVACVGGLSCRYAGFVDGFADQECLPDACDAGTCEPTCAMDSECGGRFVRRCVGADGGAGSGACRVVACSASVSCASGTTCAQPLFCCPAGAPCRAPPDGVCMR